MLFKRDRHNKVERISQESFMEAVSYRLDVADAPDEEIYWNAAFIKDELGRIGAGDLEVIPPISHEQFGHLSQKVGAIVSAHERALDPQS